jgi:hypothetical protein
MLCAGFRLLTTDYGLVIVVVLQVGQLYLRSQSSGENGVEGGGPNME